jgi:hypothetical protein
MSTAFSYTCTNVTVVKKLGQYHDKTILLCNLQFENEHGQELAPANDVIVMVEEGYACISCCPEDFLPEDHTSEEWNRYEKLCEDGYPGYDVYNDTEFSEMVAQAAIPAVTTDGQPTIQEDRTFIFIFESAETTTDKEGFATKMSFSIQAANLSAALVKLAAGLFALDNTAWSGDPNDYQIDIDNDSITVVVPTTL